MKLYNSKKEYIFSGLAIILTVLIFVSFSVTACGKKESEKTVVDTTEDETTSVVITTTEEPVKYVIEKEPDDSKILEVIKAYYYAKQEADIEALKLCVDSMEGISSNTLESYGKYIDEYQDIVCYKIEENADICDNVIFITFKYKYKGIPTPAPSYSYVQVKEQEDGSYKIHNMLTQSEMDSLEKFIASFDSDSELKAMENKINADFKTACESDGELKELYEVIK
ncbi:MAG: hypothetical protein E7266_09915 [Lachnospiraceae bacterium]|nr:hypothetical protein [Lachnospiraceae bacterium]